MAEPHNDFLEIAYTLPGGELMGNGHAVVPRLVQAIALVRTVLGFEVVVTMEGGACVRFHIQDKDGTIPKDKAYCVRVWAEIQMQISKARRDANA